MPRRRPTQRRDSRGRYTARDTAPARSNLAAVSGTRGLGPFTERARENLARSTANLRFTRGASGRFLNPQTVLSQTIRYLGTRTYDVGSLIRRHGSLDLRPTQIGVVRVHTEFARFNAGLTTFLETFGGNMHTIVKAHAFDLLSRVQPRTPVDTGRARNSWHVIPPNSSMFRFMYTDNTGRSFDGTVEATTGPFDAAVATNVEYMPALEAGHSKQAPAGMLAVSVREKSLELENDIARGINDAWRRAGR